MSNALIATRPAQHAIDAGEWAVLRDQANMLVKSGFLPIAIKTAEQAIAVILTGRELGVPMMVALRMIHVIQGTPTISPQLMLALINRSGELEDFMANDDGQICTVTMKRKGRTSHTSVFSMQDASSLGLASKDNWRKQAATMRKWRAVAACARMVFPDVIMGLYTPDEMGADVNESGEVVPAPAMVKNISIASPPDSRKQRLIARIEELWAEEYQLCGDIPAEEALLELEELSEGELTELGKTIARRVKEWQDRQPGAAVNE